MPPNTPPSPPAVSKWTLQEVVQMFKGLDLLVCDDQQAIERKYAEKRPRYLRDLKNPDPNIRHAADQWTKNVEILMRQRPEVLRVVYEAFAQQADILVAMAHVTALSPAHKDQMKDLARQTCQCDDSLAQRFVTDFQRERKLRDRSASSPLPAAPGAPPAPPGTKERKRMVVKATAGAAAASAAAAVIWFGFMQGQPDYCKLNEQVLRAEHNAPVHAVAFSPDGRTLASGGEDDMVILWDTATGKKVQALKHDGHVNALAYSKDGKLLASACGDTKVHLWNADSGEEVRSLRGHREPATSVAFSPDGSIVLSGGQDGSLRLWQTESGEFKSSVEAHQKGPVALAFSADGSQFASGGGDRKIVLWDLSSWARRATLDKHDDTVLALMFSHDGKRLASASADTKIIVWNLESRDVLQILRGGRDPMTGVLFSPDDAFVIGAGKDSTIRIWDAKSGGATCDYKNADSVLALALSRNGRALAAASTSRSVSLWTP